MKISEFVLDRINKDYFLPSVQREFVWNRERIEKLFDSLLQEYPIGNILCCVYNKELEANKLNFEVYQFIKNFDEDNPHNEEANLNGITNINLIIDGQQRLTSLFIGLKGYYIHTYYKKRKAKLYVNLFSNIENDVDNPHSLKYEFKFLDEPEEDDNKFWFEVGKVLDYKEKTAEDLKEEYEISIDERAKNDTSLIKRAKNVLGQLHKVICDSDVLEIRHFSTNDEEKILNIFVRTNDGGVKLEKADLLLSYMESDKSLFKPNGARKEIYDFVDKLNKEEFKKPKYEFAKDDILKASLVLSDLSVQYKLINFNKENLRKIDEHWSDIKKYLDTTVKLLAKYGFLENNIVSKNALIPIAYFLMKKDVSQDFLDSEKYEDIQLRNKLMRWFVISTLKRAFGSSSDTTLERMRKGINDNKDFSEIIGGQTLDKNTLMNWVDNEEYQSKYSHLILMLISDPKYWGDNCHQDHMYPESKFEDDYLRTIGLKEKEIEEFKRYRDSIANLQLLKPSINLIKTDDDFIDWANDQNKDFLKGMLTPENIDYSFKNFLNFVKIRRSMIIQKLSEVLKIEN